MSRLTQKLKAILDYVKTVPVPILSDDDRVNRIIGFVTDLPPEDPRFRRWGITIDDHKAGSVAQLTELVGAAGSVMWDCFKTTKGRQVIAHFFVPKPDPVKWLAETPEGRTKLVRAVLGPAQDRLEFVINKRRRWAEGGYSLQYWIDQMALVEGALTGEERIDRTRFLSLYSDLRATQDEIRSAYPTRKPG